MDVSHIAWLNGNIFTYVTLTNENEGIYVGRFPTIKIRFQVNIKWVPANMVRTDLSTLCSIAALIISPLLPVMCIR